MIIAAFRIRVSLKYLSHYSHTTEVCFVKIIFLSMRTTKKKSLNKTRQLTFNRSVKIRVPVMCCVGCLLKPWHRSSPAPAQMKRSGSDASYCPLVLRVALAH